MNIRPPGVKEDWDDHSVEMQAMIIAYDQTASYDEQEWEAAISGAKMANKL